MNIQDAVRKIEEFRNGVVEEKIAHKVQKVGFLLNYPQ